MAALANITINDAATTPVAHTFNPSRNGDVFVWEDRSGGIPAGYHRITLQQRGPTKDSKAMKYTLRIWHKTLEQTSASTATGIQPAPTEAYSCFFAGDFTMPMRATEQNRKDLVAFVTNGLANALLKNALTSSDNVF